MLTAQPPRLIVNSFTVYFDAPHTESIQLSARAQLDKWLIKVHSKNRLVYAGERDIKLSFEQLVREAFDVSQRN